MERRPHHAKLRGGYYTPDDLADFLVRFVNVNRPYWILEPSCGDGIFLSSIWNHIQADNPAALVEGFEIDAEAARKAEERPGQHSVENEDFLDYAVEWLDGKIGHGPFNAVVGNPPFIRYQHLPHAFQENAKRIFQQTDCHFTKLTNAWVPFLLASVAMLAPGGRLGMVVPAEILHLKYAEPLRQFLLRECRRIVLVDPQELWFEDAEQGTVMLLVEKKQALPDRCEGVGVYPVKGRQFLHYDPMTLFSMDVVPPEDLHTGKWTEAMLSLATRKVLVGVKQHPDVQPMQYLASADVGILTGANDFFLVNEATVEKWNLHRWVVPMLGKARQCPGVLYDNPSYLEDLQSGKPTSFVYFPRDVEVDEYPEAMAYIQHGVEQGYHRRYKCQVRNPWYQVPSVYRTPLGLWKFTHTAPRLFSNPAEVLLTNTAYRVQVRRNIDPDQLAYWFCNTLTALTAELEGRYYGGGVLELVPTEIDNLLIPKLLMSGNPRALVRGLDQEIRKEKDAGGDMSRVLESRLDLLKEIIPDVNARVSLHDSWDYLCRRRQRRLWDDPHRTVLEEHREQERRAHLPGGDTA